jgi:hypothetical protein
MESACYIGPVRELIVTYLDHLQAWCLVSSHTHFACREQSCKACAGIKWTYNRNNSTHTVCRGCGLVRRTKRQYKLQQEAFKHVSINPCREYRHTLDPDLQAIMRRISRPLKRMKRFEPAVQF